MVTARRVDEIEGAENGMRWTMRRMRNNHSCMIRGRSEGAPTARCKEALKGLWSLQGEEGGGWGGVDGVVEIVDKNEMI